MATVMRHLVCLFACVIGLLLDRNSAQAQVPPACSSDRPVVVPGGTLRLREFRDKAAHAAAVPRWTVPAGELVARGVDTFWKIPETLGDGARLEATVSVGDSGQSCSVSVIVTKEDLTRGPLAPSWFPLILESAPTETYGLFTYILIGSVPTDLLRERALSLLEAYIGFSPFLGEVRRYVQNPAEINATAVPARPPLPERITPESVLERYDFAAAQAIMRRVGKLDTRGIYIVSSLEPLHGPNPSPPEVVAVQDLTSIPADVVAVWVREFLSQTSSERRWDLPYLRRMVLGLRTTISVIAESLPGARDRIQFKRAGE